MPPLDIPDPGSPIFAAPFGLLVELPRYFGEAQSLRDARRQAHEQLTAREWQAGETVNGLPTADTLRAQLRGALDAVSGDAIHGRAATLYAIQTAGEALEAHRHVLWTVARDVDRRGDGTPTASEARKWERSEREVRRIADHIADLAGRKHAPTECKITPDWPQVVEDRADLPAYYASATAAWTDTSTPESRNATNDAAGGVFAAISQSAGATMTHEYRDGAPLHGNQTILGFARAKGIGTTDAEQPLSFQRTLRGIVTGDWKGADAERRAMAEGTTSAGGAFVPTELSASIIDKARAMCVVTQAGAQVVPMMSSKLDVPKWTGDPTAAWRAENAAITTSDPTVDKITLTAKSLAAIVTVSMELLEDASTDFNAKLMDSFAQAFALKLDLACLRGSGVDPEPKGIKNTAGVGSLVLGTTAGASPTWANFVNAAGTLIDANEQPNAIIWHPRTGRSLSLLTDTTGQYIVPPVALDGIPRYASTQLPINTTITTSTDCSEAYVGDFRQLILGLRVGMSVRVLDQRYAENGQIGLLGWMRADVAVQRASAFTVVTGIRP